MSVGPERTDLPKPAPPPFTEDSTRQLSVAGAGDHCVNCGAPLASDQRYCVNCGERRGKPRFTLAAAPDAAVKETTVRTASTPRRPRTSAGFNLIAGVATLLLAMGVGVLIGHSNSSANNTNGRAASTPQITINGGGASTNAAAGSSSAGSTGSSSGGGSGHASRAKHGGSSAKAAKAPPKVVVQKAAAAAAKVTGGSAKTAAPTATQGSSCSAGTAGCQNGKLTGNFFGQ
jgi:hypothetical protein